jgi:hypothetical protein
VRPPTRLCRLSVGFREERRLREELSSAQPGALLVIDLDGATPIENEIEPRSRQSLTQYLRALREPCFVQLTCDRLQLGRTEVGEQGELRECGYDFLSAGHACESLKKKRCSDISVAASSTEGSCSSDIRRQWLPIPAPIASDRTKQSTRV